MMEMAVHIERWMSAEWPGTAVMACGATVLIAENGDTTPAGADFVLPQHRKNATCATCLMLTPARKKARRLVDA